MAIWYGTKEPIGCILEVAGHVNYRKRARHYLMRAGSTKATVVTTHPDPRSRRSWNRVERPKCYRRPTACG